MIRASQVESALGISFGNRPPVAVASAPRTVTPGSMVTLDGSGSSDPDGDTLTYLWQQEQDFGSDRVTRGVTLSDNTASRPTFTAPVGPRTLRFKLTVTDDGGGSDSATVDVRVSAPSETVALSGVPSSPAVGESHSFTVTADALNSAHDYMIRVIYNDDKIGPDANRRGPLNIGTGIFTGNTSYTANFRVYGYAAGEAGITVDLRRILNREDDWSQGLLLATGGADITVAPPSETVALSGVSSSLTVGEFHSFTVTADNLNPAHDYMIRVIYNDDKIGPDATRRGPLNIGTGIFTGSASFTANFGLYGYATGDAEMTVALRHILNRADDWSEGLLLAVDEADFTVTPVYATPANFRAAATSNPGELHCTWTGPAGFDSATDQYQLRYKTETASIWSSLSMTAASYTLTNLASDGALYNVEVRAHYRDANGNTEGYSDFVSATGITSTPTNRAPIADAIGPIGTVTEGDTVSLDGTGSSDPDGDTLIYSWTQTAGPAVTLSNTASARPTFTAPAGPATLSFRLTVSDSQERTDSDTVSVSVESSTPPYTDHEDHDDHGDHTDHSDHTDRDALEAREHSDHDDHQDVTASHSDHTDRDSLSARSHSDHGDHDDLPARSHSDHLDHSDVTVSHSDHNDHNDVTASHSDHTDRDNLSARSHSDHDDHNDVSLPPSHPSGPYHSDHGDHDDLPARSHSDHLDHSDVTVSHSDHDDHNDVTASHSDHTDRDNLSARSHSDHDDLPARSHSDHLDHSDVTVPHRDHNDHDDLPARDHSDHLDHQDETVPHDDYDDHDDLPARPHSDHLDHQDETVPHDDHDDTF